MAFHKWLNLQLFAGDGDGGGEGAATGVEAVDPGQQRLLELGVPADKIRNRAKKSAPKAPESAGRTAPKQEPKQTNEQAAAADNPAEDNKTDVPSRMSWDEIMADPEYNKQMQAVVQSRLRNAKGAEETLGKLTPALELLARKHGLDPANPDYDALAKAISDDESYYEDKALEMGVSVETAKQIDQRERDTARQQRQEARTLEEQRMLEHIMNVRKQADAMKQVFPNFNLMDEMKNELFARMTAPVFKGGLGMRVEDAYHAIHHKEINVAVGQVTAQKTAQKISNSIQAGSRRPHENGTSGQAPSVTTFDYRSMSPEQRKALKERIRSGEKIYPGQM